jgi:hypothetical protein
MVMKMCHESLAGAERFRAELFQRPSFQAGQNQANDLIVSGANELYTIELE